MKLIVKRIAYLSLFTVSFLFFSCNNDDDSTEEETVDFSVENTALAARADNIMEGSQNVVVSAYVRLEEPDRTQNNTIFPDCASFTFTGGGTNEGTITVTFENDCQLFNGARVSGIINMEYGPLVAGTRTITYTYQDFTYNGNGIEGGGTITRVLENQSGNPQSTINEDITIDFEGTSVTGERSGLRISAWVEGVGSGTWTDNVYLIDGNWNTELSNGFTRTGVVTQPLRRELSCLFLVSGTIEVTQEGLSGTLDYGNGDCDAIATVTFLGQDFTVILGN